jgi:hypothetical protein
MPYYIAWPVGKLSLVVKDDVKDGCLKVRGGGGRRTGCGTVRCSWRLRWEMGDSACVSGLAGDRMNPHQQVQDDAVR